MAWIRTLTEAPGDDGDNGDDGDDESAELAELYRQARDPRTGAVDHIMSVHSLHPAGLAAHLALYTAVMRGTRTLPQVDRELVALVVSGLNGCGY